MLGPGTLSQWIADVGADATDRRGRAFLGYLLKSVGDRRIRVSATIRRFARLLACAGLISVFAAVLYVVSILAFGARTTGPIVASRVLAGLILQLLALLTAALLAGHPEAPPPTGTRRGRSSSAETTCGRPRRHPPKGLRVLLIGIVPGEGARVLAFSGAHLRRGRAVELVSTVRLVSMAIRLIMAAQRRIFWSASVGDFCAIGCRGTGLLLQR